MTNCPTYKTSLAAPRHTPHPLWGGGGARQTPRCLTLQRHTFAGGAEGDDELHTARLCRALWPGARVARLVAAIEAERARP